jgi:hypothetical protein
MWLEHVVADWRKIPPPALPVGEVSLGGEVEVGQDCAGGFFLPFSNPAMAWGRQLKRGTFVLTTHPIHYYITLVHVKLRRVENIEWEKSIFFSIGEKLFTFSGQSQKSGTWARM